MNQYFHDVLFALSAALVCLTTLVIGERVLHHQDRVQQEELHHHAR
jgi:hypothetical protein